MKRYVCKGREASYKCSPFISCDKAFEQLLNSDSCLLLQSPQREGVTVDGRVNKTSDFDMKRPPFTSHFLQTVTQSFPNITKFL